MKPLRAAGAGEEAEDAEAEADEAVVDDHPRVEAVAVAAVVAVPRAADRRAVAAAVLP